MTIFVSADHRGYELKNNIIEYLHEKGIRAEDLGAYELDPEDDYPEFGKKVAEAVLQNPQEHLGVVICGSGIGVAVAANRFHGIVCGTGFSPDQVKHARENDHINILSVPSDFVDEERAQELINAFLEATPKTEEKYLRRLKQLDEVKESASHTPSPPEEASEEQAKSEDEGSIHSL